jgi:hypothetical protein
LFWLLAHCGSSGSGQAGMDGGGNDAQNFDSSLPDTSVPEASTDSTIGGGNQGDAADAADAVEEPPAPRIPCVPTVVSDGGGASDAGTADGGDGGETEDAAPAMDGGDAGAVADASDAAMPGPCPDAMTCCSGWCTDTTRDPQNCGSCGNACMSSQFCTGTACDDAVLQNVCANARATVVLDQYPIDNEAGAALGAALANGCMPPVTVSTTPQDSGLVQAPATGRPIAGPGDTLVAGGGFFGQMAVSYMESKKIAPLSLGTDGTNAWIRNTKTGTNVVLVPNGMLTSQHDYFALEVTVEPTSGTLCFFGYGMLAPGTAAAGYFFQNDVVANRAMFPAAWYVYEWTDTDNSGTPSAGDTFSPIASGM